ncbi:MAG: MFS transporter [Terracidiphilus sp.]|nr:MFS transporter [Terracidiphilus sp.]
MSATSVQPEYVHCIPAVSAGPTSHFRWVICGLLFFATTLNYMDRQVLALLKPTLQSPIHGIGMTEVQFGVIVSIFSLAYALGQLFSGSFIDRVGSRIGYAVALSIWTLASASHALVALPAVTGPLHGIAVFLSQTLRLIPGLASASWLDSMANLSGAVIGFGIARFALGLGEAGNFPAAIKATAEWFPRRERALATGIFNSGTNIGATIAPVTVGFLLYYLGWQFAFLGTAAFALIWLVLWLTIYRAPQDHPLVSASELALINSDPVQPTTKIAWSHLLPHRQTWAFLVAKVITDPIWWFYLFWLPGFLSSRYGLSVTQMFAPLLVVYNVCTIGSVVGGWLPAQFIKMGWSLNRARKTAMLIYAIAIVPVIFISYTHTLWQAVGLISLATAAHQAWSCNLFTLASDMFPRRAVASVVGIGACGGSLSMMVCANYIGHRLQIAPNNYMLLFLFAGTGYLLAILIIHLLAPRLEVARVD